MKKKKSNQPLVSVIMPVYNAADFLEEAIQSIVRQSYIHWELIVVDDASTDSSLKIIEKFKKENALRIRVKRLSKNLNKGGDPAANVGFKMARGKYVARMDADDVAMPERLEKQVRYMEKHKEVFMLGGQAKVIDKKGKVMGVKRVPLTNGEIYEDFFVFNPIIHPTVMIRRDEVKRQNLYKIKYSANNDFLTFIEFLMKKKIVNLDEELIYYRVHDKNDSYTDIKSRFFNTLRIRLRAVKEYGYKPSLRAVLVTMCQLVVVGLVPGKIALGLYLTAKGIYSPKDLWSDWIKQRLDGVIPSLVRYEQVG